MVSVLPADLLFATDSEAIITPIFRCRDRMMYHTVLYEKNEPIGGWFVV